MTWAEMKHNPRKRDKRGLYFESSLASGVCLDEAQSVICYIIICYDSAYLHKCSRISFNKKNKNIY